MENSTELEEKKGLGRRILSMTGRVVFWMLALLVSWWIVSGLIPSIPGPGHAARSMLRRHENASDDVYHWVGDEKLREAVEMVRSEAVEENGKDTLKSDAERLSLERRARLPVLPVPEDSALHKELSALSKLPPVRGRLINVLIIGIDSRLSVRDARADALHLVTVNPDSAVVEIMSIPRDTYCDLGYPDTTSFNIIANAKLPGNGNLMKKVGELTKRGTVKYFIEVGFSQAMGILEILGYKEPVKTLQFLRTRRTLAGGDIQRAHNQALFLRQNLIDKFPLMTGATGDVIISAGLNFVTTNLTREFCLGLVYSLEQRGFPTHRPDAVRLRLLPGYNIRLKEMVADSVTINRTLAKVEHSLGENGSGGRDVLKFLRNVNRKAASDSARPGQVIHRIGRLVEQRAWLQIRDVQTRVGVRDTMMSLLERAYRKVGKQEAADRVAASLEAEKILLRTPTGVEER
ncbi:MAG: LCP family protein [Bacteroidia bacterium]|nr:LCP family protein [Bacteroidia bacterium]